jgi:hypothetical protein
MLSDILLLIYNGIDNDTDDAVMRHLADAFDAQLNEDSEEDVLFPQSEEDGVDLWRKNYDGQRGRGVCVRREAWMPLWLVGHSIDLIAYVAQYSRDRDDFTERMFAAVARANEQKGKVN